MPIEYRIDHDHRLVLVRGLGSVTDQDVFGYQREVWSQADLGGYNELVDGADRVVVPSSASIKELAQLAAGMELAIVASDEIAFGLAQVFKVYRQLEPRSTKEVSVFKSMPEALGWLGIQGDLE
jgi:hypothetical protein